MPQRRTYSREFREAMLRRMADGEDPDRIARTEGVSLQTLEQWWADALSEVGTQTNLFENIDMAEEEQMEAVSESQSAEGSGLKVFCSNSQQELVRQCADLMRTQPSADLLTPEWLVAQQEGMHRYVEQMLASHNAIAAGGLTLDFRQLVWRVYHVLHQLPPELSPRHGYFARNRLMHAILALMPRFGQYSELRELHEYCSCRPDGRGLTQLARRIAAAFERYQQYRPDWTACAGRLGNDDFAAHADNPDQGVIADFLREQANMQCGGRADGSRTAGAVAERLRGQLWQLRLWSLLQEEAVDAVRREHPQAPAALQELLAMDQAGLLERVIRELRAAPPGLSGLPQRVFVFGSRNLSTQQLSFLKALAGHASVCLMLLCPEDVSISCGSVVPAENSGHGGERSLLQTWGRRPRDTLRRLLALGAEGTELHPVFREPEGDSVLAHLQRRLLHAATPADKPAAVRADDRSLQIRCCHSPLRELEILRDAILTCLDDAQRQGRPLLPRELAVMAPDISVYLPGISAVFAGSGDDYGGALPFTIADCSLRQAAPLGEAVLELLELGRKRAGFTVRMALDLLSHAAVRRRFAVTADELEAMERWAAGAGLHWGLDDEDAAAACGEGAWVPGTCEAGLRRMLEGSLHGRPVEGAYTEIEGGAAVTLGHMYAFMQALSVLRSRLRQGPRPLGEWTALLQEEVLDGFFAGGDQDSNAQLHALREQTAQLAEDAPEAGQRELRLDEFCALLREALETRYERGLFLRHGITFCSLTAERTVPFRHIFLIGMQEQNFPRRDPAPAFDLTGDPLLRRDGDLSRTEADNQLFVDTLLTAGDGLYISYCGQSPSDTSCSEPSPVVRELLALIDESCDCGLDGDGLRLQAWGRFVSMEPQYACDPRHYAAAAAVGGGLQPLHSFSRPGRELAAVMAGSVAASHLAAAPCADLPDKLEVSLEDVIDFCRRPCRHFLREALHIQGVRLHDAEREPDDSEDFMPDRLRRGRIIERLLQETPENDEQVLHDCAAGGMLPYSILGERSAGEIQEEVRIIRQALGSPAATTCSGPLCLELEVADPASPEAARQVSITLNAAQELRRNADQSEGTGLYIARLLAYTAGSDAARQSVNGSAVLEAALRSCCAALSGTEASGQERYDVRLVYADGRSQVLRGFTKEEARPLLGRLLEFYALGQTRPLPVCEQFLKDKDEGKAMNLGDNFGYDEECRYVFAAEGSLSEPQRRRFEVFYDLYHELRTHMLTIPQGQRDAADEAGSGEGA